MALHSKSTSLNSHAIRIASNSREAYLILVMQFHARDFVYAGESLYLVSLLNYSIQFNGPM